MAQSFYVAVQRGVTGLAGAIGAIASSISPHACPRQGRRRLTPRFYVTRAGGV